MKQGVDGRQYESGPGFVRAKECPACGHTRCGESCDCDCNKKGSALRLPTKAIRGGGDTGTWYGKARLSGDGIYRYLLSRDRSLEAPSAQRVVWIGLNPSTADALDDDATIRKLKGFTSRWGYDAFDIINVFSYRTKSPKVLLEASRMAVDIVGPQNNKECELAVASAKLVVCAWGADALAKTRVYALSELLKKAPCEVVALKVTKDGAPMHPLYVRYAQEPKPFSLGEAP